MSRLMLIIVVVVGWLLREAIVWLGYSWVAGTAVAVAMLVGAFLIFNRRLLKR